MEKMCILDFTSNDKFKLSQVDEIEALSAIYPDEWKTEDESYRTYTATVKEGELTAALLITLPAEYPSSSPPYYLLTAPWMKVAERDDLCSQLEQLWVYVYKMLAMLSHFSYNITSCIFNFKPEIMLERVSFIYGLTNYANIFNPELQLNSKKQKHPRRMMSHPLTRN